MKTFPPSKWDDFLKEQPKDFYETYSRLKNELDHITLLFMALENKNPDFLHDLCMSTNRWARLWIDFDPFGRGESYNIDQIPFSEATRQLLSYARKQDIKYTQGFLGRYWQANHQHLKKQSPSRNKAKNKVSLKSSQLEDTTQTQVNHSDLCPRCKKAVLKSKDIQTNHDPMTNVWEKSRIWRCSKCYWRQKSVIEDSVEGSESSSSSLCPPEIRPGDADLGDSLRTSMAIRMKKKKVGPKILKELGNKFEHLLHQEKELDYAIIPKQSRRIRPLHDIEIQFLMLLLSEHKDMYTSNIKQHWDKMIGTQQMQSWPLKELHTFLQDNPTFMSSVSSSMCPTCLIKLKCTYTEYRNMDVSTPNPIDLRPEKIEHWTCGQCQYKKRIRTDF